jgi:hypothetical protein
VHAHLGTLAHAELEQPPLLLAERRVGVVHHLRQVVGAIGEDLALGVHGDAVTLSRQLDDVPELGLDEVLLRLGHRRLRLRRDVDLAVVGERHRLAGTQGIAHLAEIAIVTDRVLRRGVDVVVTGHVATVMNPRRPVTGRIPGLQLTASAL